MTGKNKSDVIIQFKMLFQSFLSIKSNMVMNSLTYKILIHI